MAENPIRKTLIWVLPTSSYRFGKTNIRFTHIRWILTIMRPWWFCVSSCKNQPGIMLNISNLAFHIWTEKTLSGSSADNWSRCIRFPNGGIWSRSIRGRRQKTNSFVIVTSESQTVLVLSSVKRPPPGLSSISLPENRKKQIRTSTWTYRRMLNLCSQASYISCNLYV